MKNKKKILSQDNDIATLGSQNKLLVDTNENQCQTIRVQQEKLEAQDVVIKQQHVQLTRSTETTADLTTHILVYETLCRLLQQPDGRQTEEPRLTASSLTAVAAAAGAETAEAADEAEADGQISLEQPDSNHSLDSSSDDLLSSAASEATEALGAPHEACSDSDTSSEDSDTSIEDSDTLQQKIAFIRDRHADILEENVKLEQKIREKDLQINEYKHDKGGRIIIEAALRNQLHQLEVANTRIISQSDALQITKDDVELKNLALLRDNTALVDLKRIKADERGVLQNELEQTEAKRRKLMIALEGVRNNVARSGLNLKNLEADIKRAGLVQAQFERQLDSTIQNNKQTV